MEREVLERLDVGGGAAQLKEGEAEEDTEDDGLDGEADQLAVVPVDVEVGALEEDFGLEKPAGSSCVG